MKPLTPYEREIVANIFKKAKLFLNKVNATIFARLWDGHSRTKPWDTLRTTKPSNLPGR